MVVSGTVATGSGVSCAMVDELTVHAFVDYGWIEEVDMTLASETEKLAVQLSVYISRPKLPTAMGSHDPLDLVHPSKSQGEC